MTKNAFLNRLSEDVSILSDTERQDIMSEYEQHLEMKINAGMSEEEATADFEPYDEFISELLSAYHINPNYQTEESTNFGSSLRRAGLFLQRSLDVLLSLNSKELGYVLSRSLMLLVVTLGIALAPKIIFGISFSFMLPYDVRSVFSGFVNFLYGIFVFSLVCYAIYYGLSRYLLPLRTERDLTEMRLYDDPYTATAQDPESSADHPSNRLTAKTEPHHNGYAKKRIFARPDNASSNEDLLGRIFMFLLKMCFLLIFFLPLLCFDLLLVIATGSAFAGVILGYPLIGITLICLGASLLGILLFIAVWRATFMEA